MRDPLATGMPELATLRARLARVRRDIKRFYFYDGINRVIAVGAVLAALALAEQGFLGVPTPALVSTCVVFGVVLLAVAIRYLVYPLTRRISDADVALAIEREYPLLNDRLITALELPTMGQRRRIGHSPALARAVIGQAVELLDQLNLKEVVKPNQLARMGLVAVGASLLLAYTSFAVALHEQPRPLTFEVVIPRSQAEVPGNINDPELARALGNSNFQMRSVEHDDPDYQAGIRTEIVIADKAPLVLLAIPRQRRGMDRLTLEAYGAPVVVLADRAGNARRETAYTMKAPIETQVPQFARILDTLRDGQILEVRWEKRRSERYRLAVRPAPRIDQLTIAYEAPPHMRPREIPLTFGPYDEPGVAVVTAVGEGFTLQLPRLDAEGHILTERGTPLTETHHLNSAAEFQASFPELYRRHFRLSIDTQRDALEGTEGTLVTLTIETNKPLHPLLSTLVIQRTPTGDEPAEQPLALTATNAERTVFAAKFHLATAMTGYRFHLVDDLGLKQRNVFTAPIKVRPDATPRVSFVSFGNPLTEGDDELVACPEGRIPMVIHATDDFGLRNLRLLYWVGDNEAFATDVPGFSAKAVFQSFPREHTVEFEVRLADLKGIEITEDTTVSLSFRIDAEDNKLPIASAPGDAAPGASADGALHGQIGSATSPRVRVKSQNRLRDQIRYLLSKQIKRRLLASEKRQRGLLEATHAFAADAPLLDLEAGVLDRLALFGSVGATDTRTKAGVVAARYQDGIVRTAASAARLLDAISRQYIYNDLESEDPSKREENAIHTMKYLLGLNAVPKKDGLELSDQLQRLHEEREQARIARLVKNAVRDATGATSATGILPSLDRIYGFTPSRRRFDTKNFAAVLKKAGIVKASAAREATLAFEQALAPGVIDVRKQELMRAAIPLEEMSRATLRLVLKQLRLWEGYDEIRRDLEELRRLMNDFTNQIPGLKPDRRPDR